MVTNCFSFLSVTLVPRVAPKAGVLVPFRVSSFQAPLTRRALNDPTPLSRDTHNVRTAFDNVELVIPAGSVLRSNRRYTVPPFLPSRANDPSPPEFLDGSCVEMLASSVSGNAWAKSDRLKVSV